MIGSAQTNWHAIAVTVPPAASDAIESAFNAMDSLGTEINNLRPSSDAAVTILGYFDRPPADEMVRGELEFALQTYGLSIDEVISIEHRIVENTDWLAEWKKHWKPTNVGRFVIAPPWADVKSEGRIVIRIEPNMAFGTGTHETTQLCLEAIERNYSAGQSFLDIGTGTGILAIAAAKIGVADKLPTSLITAFDIDPQSVAIARENAVMNGVADRINFAEGSVLPDSPLYDQVCANLTLDVILPLLPILLGKANNILILSGILAEQADEILAELVNSGFERFEVESRGEWVSVTVRI
jgi:ribosomal protein L11 methyltransferase